MTTLLLDPGKDALYLAIVKAIRREIGAGRLSPGDRLPTHRELADELGVAIGTVTRAYAEAERQGLVNGEIGRGTFVKAPDGEASDRAAAPVIESDELIDFSQNYPLYALDPDLAGTLAKISKRSDLQPLLRYEASEGSARGRETGRRWIASFGVETEASRVAVCAGAQHAIHCAFSAVAEPGDLIVSESLVYPGARASADLLQLKLVGAEMDEHGVLPEAIERLCRQRRVRAIYLSPTLQNPTVTVLSKERRRRIVEIAREHDLWIIEDDVHRRLMTSPPTAIATLAPERTFFIAGTSKSVSGGLRVAFVSSPVTHVGRVARAVWASVFLVAPLCVEVFGTWLEDGTADSTVEAKRRESAARQELAARWLQGFKYCAHPEALNVWLELPEPWTVMAFVAAARERGVAVTSSEAFQVGDGPLPQAVRLCLSAPLARESVEQGLRIVADILSAPPGLSSAVV